MSRVRKMLLMVPILLLVLACQSLMGPVNDVKNVAGTAGAIETQALELATQAVPMETAFANPTGNDGGNATSVPLPGEGADLYNPQDPPLSSWQEIPIMPNASAGAEGQGMYSFKVDATLQEVQAFYDAQLPPLGWTSTLSGSGLPMLIYSKGEKYISITILEQAGGTIVLLTPS